MASIRRDFTDEFKAEAVRLVTVEGHCHIFVGQGARVKSLDVEGSDQHQFQCYRGLQRHNMSRMIRIRC